MCEPAHSTEIGKRLFGLHIDDAGRNPSVAESAIRRYDVTKFVIGAWLLMFLASLALQTPLALVFVLALGLTLPALKVVEKTRALRARFS
jgi:hypothetical protein